MPFCTIGTVHANHATHTYISRSCFGSSEIATRLANSCTATSFTQCRRTMAHAVPPQASPATLPVPDPIQPQASVHRTKQTAVWSCCSRNRTASSHQRRNRGQPQASTTLPQSRATSCSRKLPQNSTVLSTAWLLELQPPADQPPAVDPLQRSLRRGNV